MWPILINSCITGNGSEGKMGNMELYIKKFGELALWELYEILKLRVDVLVVGQNCPYRR